MLGRDRAACSRELYLNLKYVRKAPDVSACSSLALESVLPSKRCLRGAVALLCPIFAALRDASSRGDAVTGRRSLFHVPPGCLVLALNPKVYWGMLGWVADGENQLLAMKQKLSISKDVRKLGQLFCLHIISISSSVLPLPRKPRVVSAICF